ncbi:MAG TPA: DUF4407 domain-containing protein [Longimicrobium sp.]
MKRFFLFCSGANTDVLRECPTDESKYVGIGVTILLTAILASLSGGYALYTVFGLVPVAAAFGVLWGAVIFNLDRVIVSGMRKQKHFALDLLYAAPRFVISVLLAVVISRPLELRLFEGEIQLRWDQMQSQARNSDVDRIRAGDGERLDSLRAENARMRAEIDARQNEYNRRNDEWIREKEGTGGTMIPGAGPVFAEKDTARKEALRQWEEIKSSNLPRIGRNDSVIARLEAQQDRNIARTDSVRSGADGFLARMEAFGSLKKDSETIRWASIFITLLFISLETAPVVVKLLSTFSPYRPYDELLEQREFELVEKVRQSMRVKRHELKTNAELEMADRDSMFETEQQLNSDKHQLRLDAELRANEALMRQVADAQAELAGHMVEDWRRKELAKMGHDVDEYAEDFA